MIRVSVSHMEMSVTDAIFDVRDYVLALESALTLGDVFIPIPMAASTLAVEQTTIRGYIRKGDLKPFQITSAWDEKWSGVSARSLLAKVHAIDKEISNLIEPIDRDLKSLGGKKVEYGKLMEKHGLSWKNPNDRKLVGIVLGEVSMASWKEHGVVLSVQVVAKKDNQPNSVFFELEATQEAMGAQNPESFVIEHLKLIQEKASAGDFG